MAPKSWIVEYRPHGGGRGVAKRRATLGKVGTLTPDQARKKAADMLAQVRLGADPAAERAESRKALTVSGLIDAFVAEHVDTKLKVRTAEGYKITLARLRSAHGGLKAQSLTPAQLSTLHSKMRDVPYAGNRALAVLVKMFAWASVRGLVPKGHNPAHGIERYREAKRERFLTSEELSRLGAALAEGETIGLPYAVNETKPKAKHAPKEENRRAVADPFAVAAIRLLILTGARLREILARSVGIKSIWSAASIFTCKTPRPGRSRSTSRRLRRTCWPKLPRIEGNPHLIPGDRRKALLAST